jgi:hypothetical protein
MHWWENSNDLSSMSGWGWVLLAVVLLTQSIYIFQDAQKRGAKAWLWGLYGLTSVPTAFLVYWFCVVRKKKKNTP